MVHNHKCVQGAKMVSKNRLRKRFRFGELEIVEYLISILEILTFIYIFINTTIGRHRCPKQICFSWPDSNRDKIEILESDLNSRIAAFGSIPFEVREPSRM